ncbi:metabotropic glutamate receptor-like [Diabrotica virgifera virgifera]|uniref:Receptor ligand binding region domain-containing protein n=1 Tax=Diabrotica virgifera virgifera TaxID=50390 RepID=A0ABM5JHF5_DIAVI|nr:metabotropic glutamate receptor-like [Diabrotica virgifera virgifera]
MKNINTTALELAQQLHIANASSANRERLFSSTFGLPFQTTRILQAAKRLNASQAFYWVASDGWGKQQKLVEGLEDVAEGAITVELQSNNIPGFDAYMMSLTPERNTRNPWFEQYWEDTFACVLEKNIPLETNYTFNVCSPELRLSQRVGYEQESKVQFVVDAVYAFALALHNLHEDICKDYNQSGICPAMVQYDGGEFYKKYLLNMSFTDLAGSPVKFDDSGDGLARYDILNYQRHLNSSGYHYRVSFILNKYKLNHFLKFGN